MCRVDEYLDRPGARLAYSRTGSPRAEAAVVVAHSLATSRQWEDEAGIFDWSDVASADRQLVRFDTRGHGASSGRIDPEQYRWPALADDLIAVSGAVAGGRAVDGLGESTGCGVLLWAALAAPDRFRRLVLVIPPTRGEERAQQAELYTAAAELVELRGADAWRRLTVTAAQAPILREGGWDRPARVPIREELLPAVLRGAASSDFPADDAIRTIRQPALILAWDTDLSHPVSTAEHLAQQLPDSRLEIATAPDAIRGWGRRAAAFLQG